MDIFGHKRKLELEHAEAERLRAETERLKADAEKDAKIEAQVDSFMAAQGPKLWEAGITREMVKQYVGYERTDPREEKAEQLENSATRLVMQAERDLHEGRSSDCLEKLYRARVAMFEAIEIHKGIDEKHPALDFLNIGLVHLDKSIEAVGNAVQDDDRDDYPDYPIY